MGKPSEQKLREARPRTDGALQCNRPDSKLAQHRVLPAGDMAILVELGDGVDPGTSAAVLALARRLDEKRLKGVIETVPTLRSLMICYDPLVLPATALVLQIERIIEELAASERLDCSDGRCWTLPVCYDRRFAPDLEAVASRTGLKPAQVIERHSASAYHVYMLGSLPGQAYMGDLPSELVLPRRETPRLRVAPGSLAIATTMTCIFPSETPCGWHLIGRSPVALWEGAPRPRALLAPGDQVTFKPISLREYEDMRRKGFRAAVQSSEKSRIEAAA